MASRKLAQGDVVRQRRAGVTHTYEVAGFRPHTMKSGRQVRLTILRGTCAVCGKAFLTTSRSASRNNLDRYLARTCERHRGDYRANGSGVAR